MRHLSKENLLQTLSNVYGMPGFQFVLSGDLIEDYGGCFHSYCEHTVALIDLARYEEANRSLEEAEKRCPKEKAHFICHLRGELSKAKGEFREAEKCFRRSLESRADDADGYLSLGAILAGQGKLEEAKLWHQQAIRCSKGCVDEAYLNLGYVLRAQEQFEDALECFEKALEIDPNYEAAKVGSEDMKTLLAYLQSEQSQETQVWTAKERLQRSRDAANDSLAAYALILVRELIQDHDKYGPAYLDYGVALVELARYEEAGIALKKSMDLYSEDNRFMPCCHLGHLHELKGEFREAARWYIRAIKLKPHNAETHENLGHLLARQGNLEEAEQCYLTALECPEGRLDEAYTGLGCVLRSLERFNEALECFQKAFELDPESEEAELGIRDMNLVIDYLKDAAER
ncbi:MAG: tetratricopeptide repeat protein [Phycisphaerales bacterium]|nr:MAG: tetratricopeptide repeat protein [Phycisphaerales bacterium]